MIKKIEKKIELNILDDRRKQCINIDHNQNKYLLSAKNDCKHGL